MKTKILYIEDEPDLGNVTKQYLEMMDFEVAWCLTGESAYQSYISQHADIVIIDVQLPDTDGFMLAQRILAHNEKAYFLFLTARNIKEDKIRGLKLGAIDYITKPFDIDELILRIRNFANRQLTKQRGSDLSMDEIIIDDLKLNMKLLSLRIGSDYNATLTVREAELLKYFCEHKNQIIKREDILLNIWGENDYFLGRSLDVFVSRMRKLLSKSATLKIENVYGVGFKFSTKG